MEPEQMHQDAYPVAPSGSHPQVFLSSSSEVRAVDAHKGDNFGNFGSKELLKQRGACLNPQLQYGKADGTSTNTPAAKNESHQGASGGEGSSTGAAGGSDLGLKPSLLEEVLTDKKLALMRSPEVIRFLQMQQANLVTNSKLKSNDKSEKS